MTGFQNNDIKNMTADEVVAHVAKSQHDIAKAMDTYRRKSRKEHALLILSARTFIKTMEQSLPADKQADLLTRHQIKAALNGTSSYTPWIKLLFGKHAADGATVKFGGQEHVKWEADASYGRYFNFFEVIDRDFKGTEDELLDWVLKKGGPSTIVAEELARKREAAKPSGETVKAHRNLYLEVVDTPMVDIPADLLGETAEFVSVILRRTEAGLTFLGVAKKDATGDFDRLASNNFDALTKAKGEREAANGHARDLEAATERGRQEGEQRLAESMGLSVEEMRERVREIAASAKAKVDAARTDQQAAG